jgi:hypothetical protein
MKRAKRPVCHEFVLHFNLFLGLYTLNLFPSLNCLYSCKNNIKIYVHTAMLVDKCCLIYSSISWCDKGLKCHKFVLYSFDFLNLSIYKRFILL